MRNYFTSSILTSSGCDLKQKNMFFRTLLLCIKTQRMKESSHKKTSSSSSSSANLKQNTTSSHLLQYCMMFAFVILFLLLLGPMFVNIQPMELELCNFKTLYKFCLSHHGMVVLNTKNGCLKNSFEHNNSSPLRLYPYELMIQCSKLQPFLFNSSYFLPLCYS
jgi:hypothetical protein